MYINVTMNTFIRKLVAIQCYSLFAERLSWLERPYRVRKVDGSNPSSAVSVRGKAIRFLNG